MSNGFNPKDYYGAGGDTTPAPQFDPSQYYTAPIGTVKADSILPQFKENDFATKVNNATDSLQQAKDTGDEPLIGLFKENVAFLKHIVDYYNLDPYTKAKAIFGIDTDGPSGISVVKQKAINFYNGLKQEGGSIAEEFRTDPIKATKDAVAKPVSAVANLFSQEGIVGLIKGVSIGPAEAALTTATGYNFGDPTQLRQASSEQRITAGINTLANAAAIYVGAKVGGLVENKLAGQGVSSAVALGERAALPIGVPTAVTTPELSVLGKGNIFVGSGTKALVRQAIAHSTGAYGAGLAFGMIEGANNENQANNMFGLGLQFAPLGIASAILHSAISKGVGGEPELIARHAEQLSQWRQFRATIDDAIPDVFEKLDAFTTAGNLAGAVAQTIKPGEFTIVRGLEKYEADNLGTEGVVTRQRPDGKYDVMVYKPEPIIQTPTEALEKAPPLPNVPLGEVGPRVKANLEAEQSLQQRLVSKGVFSPEELDAFKRNDNLGFDSITQAANAILSDPNWKKNWDIPPGDQAVIEKWRANTIGEPQVTFPDNIINSFKEHGFATNQVVSYDGRNYVISSIEPSVPLKQVAKTVILEDITNGGKIKVNLDDIQDLSGNGLKDFWDKNKQGQTWEEEIRYKQKLAAQARTDPELLKKVKEPVDVSHYSDDDLRNELAKTQARLDYYNNKNVDHIPGLDNIADQVYNKTYLDSIKAEIAKRGGLTPEEGPQVTPEEQVAAQEADVKRREFNAKTLAEMTPEQRAAILSREKPVAPPISELPPVEFVSSKTIMGRLYDDFLDVFRDKKGDLSVIPSKGFGELVQDFANAHGLDNVEAFKREFGNRVAKDLLREGLTDEEHAVYTAAVKDYAGEKLSEIRDSRTTLAKVIRQANRAGLLLDNGDANMMYIRDITDGRLVAVADGLEKTRDFINRIGAAKGIDLDGGDNGPIPPWAIGGDLINPPPPPENIGQLYNPNAITRTEKLVALTNTLFKFAATNNKLFLDLDILYNNKTRFFNDVFRVAQQGLTDFSVNMQRLEPELLRLQARARAFDAERRRIIGQSLETQTPDEIKAENGYYKNRSLSEPEISFGEWLAEKNVDIGRMFDFIASRRIATRGMAADSPEYAAEIQRIKNDMGLAKDPITWEAIKRADAHEGDLGPSVRLARSIMNKEVSFNDFVKQHNFSNAELGLVKDIQEFYKRMVDEFNIPEARIINSYMTHARLYEDGEFTPRSLSRYAKNFEQDIDTKFYARMARTGEIDAFERDPIVSLVRYTRAGLKAKYMMGSLDQAVKNGEAILEQIKGQPHSSNAARIMQQYFNTIRGTTPPIDTSVNAFLDHFNKKLGLDIDARKLANFISLTGETAAQGFKLAAGARDFVTNAMTIYSEFGIDKTRKFMQYGMLGVERSGIKLSQEDLMARGIVHQRGALILENPVERTAQFDASKYVRFANKAANISETVSMQPAAYRFAHTGAYMTFWADAADALKGYADKSLNKAEAYSRIGINKFEAPIRAEFDRLVEGGKFEEAADYIGRVASEQLIGRFGQANGLHFSNNIAGRIAGQFGTWGSFYGRGIARLISTGTLTERAAKIARLGVAAYALASAEKKTGLNLHGWYTAPVFSRIFDPGAPLVPASPTLGPLADSGYELIKAATSSGNRSKEALRAIEKITPYNFRKDQFEMNPHLWLPFSFEISNTIKAIDLYNRGKTTQALEQAAGLRQLRPGEK